MVIISDIKNKIKSLGKEANYKRALKVCILKNFVISIENCKRFLLRDF